MNGDGEEKLSVILDVLSTIQEQLEGVDQRCRRIEAAQADLASRVVGSDDQTRQQAQAVVRLESEQIRIRRSLRKLAQLAGLTHDAAMGEGAPLPASLVDDPLLELYLLTRPADRRTEERALTDWRAAAKAASSAELVSLLARQYVPSPSDTAASRILRYQLAAITRDELKGRGASLPEPPTSTFAEDRSAEALRRRSADLARLWRGGESAALYAEPELAGAVDLFSAAEERGAGNSEEQLTADLVDLHRGIATRLEAGERPGLVGQGVGPSSPTGLADIALDQER